MKQGNLLKINLLPQEFLASQKEYQKFHKIQIACILIILTLAFLASLTVALRVIQTQKVSAAQELLDEYTNKVGGFKETEAQLLVLKNRLSAIGRLSLEPSKQRLMYNLINQLLPSQIVVNSLNVDSLGNVNLALIAQDVTSLQVLLDSLLDPASNEGLISKVEVENLTRSRDGFLRVGLKIVPN